LVQSPIDKLTNHKSTNHQFTNQSKPNAPIYPQNPAKYGL
jgi:hypothetical protein